jgi:hypothetical protein
MDNSLINHSLLRKFLYGFGAGFGAMFTLVSVLLMNPEDMSRWIIDTQPNHLKVNKALSEPSEQILKLKEQILKLEEEIYNLNGNNSFLNSEILSLEKQLQNTKNTLNSQIAQLKKQLQEKQNQIKNQQLQIKNQNQQIAELKKKVNEFEKTLPSPDTTSANKKGLYGLTVNPSPSDATVKIMNIPPKYVDGIQLEPGKYDIKVSRHGYKTWRKWINIKNEDVILSIPLTKTEKITIQNDGISFNGKRIEMADYAAISPDQKRVVFSYTYGASYLIIMNTDTKRRVEYKLTHSYLFSHAIAKNLVWINNSKFRFFLSGSPNTISLGNYKKLTEGTYEARIDAFNSILKLKKFK